MAVLAVDGTRSSLEAALDAAAAKSLHAKNFLDMMQSRCPARAAQQLI
ncbi:hypothetical protein [Noviherbaspirillum aerium]|nr:hypothetical protein [Noviherbaspirillum aerium]